MAKNFDVLTAESQWARKFETNYRRGANAWHVVRNLTTAIVDGLDALLEKHHFDIRVALDRPRVLSPDSDVASHWRFLIVADDSVATVSLELSEKIAIIGDRVIFLANEDGPFTFLDALVSEIEQAAQLFQFT